MSDTDLVEIIVPDDGEAAPPEKPGKKPAAENVASEDQLAPLKAQIAALETEKQKANDRAEAEAARATAATSDVARQTQDKFYAQEVAVTNALAQATTEREALTGEIERLQAAGEFGAAARAYAKLADAAARVVDIERQQKWVDQQKQTWTKQQEEAAEAAKRPPQQQVSSAAAAWIDAHPQFNSDASYRAIAIGADAMAKKRGIKVDTPEYFEFIEEQLGERQPVQQQEEPPAQRQTARSTSTAVPPSRSTPVAGGGKTQRLTLTQAEREMADATMAHVKDANERYLRYARNKQKMLQDNPLVQ